MTAVNIETLILNAEFHLIHLDHEGATLKILQINMVGMPPMNLLMSAHGIDSAIKMLQRSQLTVVRNDNATQ